jgi:hypothetical protein
MKQSIAKISILSLALIMGLVACSPSSREKDTNTKPPQTVEPDVADPDVSEPDVPVVVTPDDSLKVGDIIFHKSQSKQSKAIFEASGSEWTHVGILISKNGHWFVSEAIGPVVSTPLQDFINRGKDKEYKIYRFKHFKAETMENKLLQAIEQQNKAYDIYFEFSDENTYCSELVYKAMLEVTGQELGVVQQFKDLKLNGPYVKAMIKKRLTDKGRLLNVEEPIITPASQMSEANLILIKESIKTEDPLQ